METILTPSNIMFVLGILGAIFTVYNYFKNPQINSEKTDALLQQRVQWEKESTDKKFSEFGKRLEDAFLLASNHTHTVDVKVDGLIKTVGVMSNEITKLTTIIEERIPKK